MPTSSTPSRTSKLIRCSSNKSNRLNLLEARRPEEVGKTDNPNFFLYHKMLRHPTKSFYIFKDILQVLIDAEVLKLCLERKKVTANMMSFFSLGYAFNASQSGSHPKRRVINTDPHHQREKGPISVPTPQGEIMWVHPDLMESQQWTTLPTGSPKVKKKLHLVMWCVLSPGK